MIWIDFDDEIFGILDEGDFSGWIGYDWGDYFDYFYDLLEMID